MSDRKKYLKNYRLTHKEKYREYQAKYRKTHLTTYEKLQQENQQLKDNWNDLKEWLEELQEFKGINMQGFSWGVAQEVLDKMEELEKDKSE